MTDHIVQQIQNAKTSCVITPAEGSHKAYLISRLFANTRKSMVVILKNVKATQQFFSDLQFFMPEIKDRILLFPGYHIQAFKSLSYHKETSVKRLAALFQIMDSRSDENPLIIITHVDTVLQKLIPKETINTYAELLMANEEFDRQTLIDKLTQSGYQKTSLVEDEGEYAVRGGILDVFSPGQPHPVRIEFFGDLVESIRYFNVYTQRGIKELNETIILPATETVITPESLPHVLARLRSAAGKAQLEPSKIREYVNKVREFGGFAGIESMLSIVYEKLDSLIDYIPEDAYWVLDDPVALAKSAEDAGQKAYQNFEMTVADQRLCVEPETILMDWDTICRIVDEKKSVRFQSLEIKKESTEHRIETISFPCLDNQDLTASLHPGNKTENPLKPLVEKIEETREKGVSVLFAVSQESQAKRLKALLNPYGIDFSQVRKFNDVAQADCGIYMVIGNPSSGFFLEDIGCVIITDEEIFGKKRIRRVRSVHRDLKTEFIAPEELKDGDIVVHVEHGVGRYKGLCSLTVSRITQDFILIEYKDRDKLYLPVDRIEMIGKYIGVDGYIPVLDKIGSKAWVKSKVKAKKEVEKLAAELLDLYAKRRVNKGFAFSRPDNMYNDFEAGFPFEETKDQLRAIDDVQLDMERQIPMDRLVCGDVGYGKTEVAIRAAFKAVQDGRQVAVVVPTTILAEQHYQTFTDRFKDYPVMIECLSRFRKPKEQKEIVKKISTGRVDIVIGTHRLLQKDIDFNALGLLVIDEEQRFGVKHKEALKKKRSDVDVLALTATPIPRTLHLSLTGMRDISIISTPPADRQPIVSYISTFDDTIVKDAVKKELDRGGQVFFVHNNIQSIDKTAAHLKELIPQAKIGIAHGRLSETQLETVMFRFIHSEIDVLVCTTIIESGLDIPAANTMIINKAERFGLSQIYQLRGRIGRGEHQAYAYLFISDETRLTKDAQKRLSALMEYKDLGSGFQIAMKDLQIRGAGSALGASQSGHIAAVGYDLFLKLLDQAIHDLKGDTVVEPLEPEMNIAMSAGFPDTYIESVEQRLTLYRRLSRIDDASRIAEFKKELVDRYGKLPEPADNMLVRIMLRVYCIKAGVQKLDLTPTTLTLTFSLRHRADPFSSFNWDALDSKPYQIIKKDCIRIQLAAKRSKISRALLETRNILKALS